MLLLASLIAVAAGLPSAGSQADTTVAASSRAVCATGLAMSTTTAMDLRAALEAHGGAVRWDLARGPIRVWVQRRPDFAADVSVTAAEWRRAVYAATEAWHDIVPVLAFALEADSARASVGVTGERNLKGAATGSGLSDITAR